MKDEAGAEGTSCLQHDVLVEVSGYLSLAEIRNCLQCCRRWYSAFCADAVWIGLARRCFVQLPIVCLAAEGHGKVPPKVILDAEGASRRTFLTKRWELLAHRLKILTQKEVQLVHPYILHALLIITWGAAAVFLALLLCVLEDWCPATMGQAFGVLHTSYVALFVALLFNVIAVTHWEPMPLGERIFKHRQLIGTSGISLAVVLLFAGATRIFEYNVASPKEARWPWVLCFMPVFLILSFWQVLATLAARPRFIAWMRSPALPTWIELHIVLTTLFPSLIGLAFFFLGQYIETGVMAYLIIASVPFLFGTLSVTVTLAVDFVHNRRISDAFGSFSTASLSAFPVGFMVAEPRGLHVLPLLFFITSLALAYAHEWVKKRGREWKLQKLAPKVARMRA